MLTDNEIRLKIAELKGYKDNGVMNDGAHEFYLAVGVDNRYHYIDGRVCDPKLPDWPTDISAAWGLVEEIKASGIWFMMGNPDFNPDAAIVHGWWAKLYLPDDDTGGIEIEQVADTAARAICLAWLKWKGVDNDQ